MNRVARFGSWKKYGNHKVERNGIHYDSKLESKVGWELELRQKAGEIKEIKRQVDFPMVVNGFKICTYRADFHVVFDDDTQGVYEAKGIMLPMGSLKLKLFEALYPEIKLTVVRQ